MLWVTFFGNLLWWCFSKREITQLPDGTKTRPAIDQWRPRRWGISAPEDQRIGSIIMWVPAHMVFVIPFTVAFFRWARAKADEEDETTSPEGRWPS